MKRRELVRALGVGALATGALAACSSSDPAGSAKTEVIHWKMVTTWPKNFPGLGVGANNLAKLIGELSGGRIRVKVYGARELVDTLETFDAVSAGTAEMGHGAAFYWKDRVPAAQFFSAVPFGLTAQEMNSWLYYGGGMELWQEVYAEFGLVPMAAGNTGVQMGGWFNRPVDSVEDLRGLKMRIPGLGGEVLKRAGGEPVLLPGGEIFPSLQSGAIDATEWVGPYNDLAFGLHKAARYYYYPGWHEPGTTLEVFVNRQAFEALPEDLRAIVRAACRVANQDMLADFTARNNAALQRLISDHKVELRKFPDEVLIRLKELSEEVLAEEAGKDPLTGRVYESFRRFREQAAQWHSLSEQAFMNARAL